MAEIGILGISGSLREGSFNRKLIREAGRIYGGAYTEAYLRLPLYDGDLEGASGVPAEAQLLADQVASAQAVVISTPEYNSSISGVLKNALDWVSRVEGHPWAGKPVAIMSSAAGRAGGARAHQVLRLAMAPFRPNLVAGPEVMVASSYQEFDEDGRLKSESYIKALSELMEALRAAAS